MKYNLKKDHTEIKKQIKNWEIRLDEIVVKLMKSNPEVSNDIEEITYEMMSINI